MLDEMMNVEYYGIWKEALWTDRDTRQRLERLRKTKKISGWQVSRLRFKPINKDGGLTILRNVGELRPDYMALYVRIQ
jgi:hypothetical protein